MLLDKVINHNFAKMIFAAIIAYYFGLLFLQIGSNVFALLGVVVFIIIYLIKIEYAFYFVIVSRTFVEIFYQLEAGGNLKITQFLGGLFVTLFLFYFIVVNRETIFRLLVNKIYWCFLIVSIPSIFFTESTIYGIGNWFKLFQGFLFLNITVLILTKAGPDSFKKKINIISLCVVLAILYPYFLFVDNFIHGVTIRGTGKIERFSGFASTYNHFAYFLFFIFPFCVLLQATAVKLKKALLTAFIGIIIVTIFVFSHTRNIWIAFFVFFITWCLIHKKYIFTFFIISAAVSAIAIFPDVQDRLSDIIIVMGGTNFMDLDPILFSGRIGTWQGNISYLIENSSLIEILFGHGFDIRFRVPLPQTDRPMETHSNFVYLLMNTGICGLVLYMIYLIKLFHEAFKLLKRTKDVYMATVARVAICLLFSYLSISAITHILLFLLTQYYFSIFVGFVVAGNIIEERRESLQHQEIAF